MKINDILTEATANPDVVKKFAGVSDRDRSYYIMKWSEEKGIDSDEAMELAGYKKGSYRGYGNYDWHYNPPRESIANEAPAGMLGQIGRKIGAKVAGAVGAKGDARDYLIEGLTILKNRGYDSAGIATMDEANPNMVSCCFCAYLVYISCLGHCG